MELASFQQSASEEAVLQTLREQMDLYVLLQYHVHNQLSHRFELDSPVVLNMQDYMKLVRPVIPNKSNVVYLQVLDAKSDSKDTHANFTRTLPAVYNWARKKTWC